MASSYRIVLTGGGSGGHIYPLLAVAEELQKIAAEKQTPIEILYIGPEDSYTAILKERGIQTHAILGAKWRRYASPLNIIDIPKFFISLIQAFTIMFLLMPDAVFSKGGTGALPVVVSGWFYRIPVVIHESDATPGLTNAISSRFATRIAVSFESCAAFFNPRITFWTGPPLRNGIFLNPVTQETAKKELGLDPQKPVILILGGSQGSRTLNDFVLANLAELLTVVQIIHQTGTENYKEVEQSIRGILLGLPSHPQTIAGYKPFAYIDNMKQVLTAADLIISRAGSQLFEFAALKKPSILIPHGASNNHQRKNAYEFAKTEGALIIEEENLLPTIIIKEIKTLLASPALLQKMGEQAGSFYKPGGAQSIAEELMKLV